MRRIAERFSRDFGNAALSIKVELLKISNLSMSPSYLARPLRDPTRGHFLHDWTPRLMLHIVNLEVLKISVKFH